MVAEETIQPETDMPAEVPGDNLGEGQDDDFKSGKIYCANCINCKLTPARQERGNRYVLRIRCAAGKWKKKMGEEKLFKYAALMRRCIDECDAYDAMGDPRDFIRELRKTISGKDEVYLDGMDDDPAAPVTTTTTTVAEDDAD